MSGRIDHRDVGPAEIGRRYNPHRLSRLLSGNLRFLPRNLSGSGFGAILLADQALTDRYAKVSLQNPIAG
jgi:hypothetical protein